MDYSSHVGEVKEYGMYRLDIVSYLILILYYTYFILTLIFYFSRHATLHRQLYRNGCYP
jgi:hypothetical protein